MKSLAPDQATDAASVGRGVEAVKSPILEISNLRKTYRSAGHELTVLRDINLTLFPGDTCALIGPSGSGKTTLLGLCAGLDDATSGTVRLGGQALEALDQDARAALRNRLVGFVFQNFQLIPTLTAIENVLVPLELRGEAGRQKEAADILSQVGLAERLHHYPLQLSGGEQQRVALARAFIHRPKILFADEPTGNLDAATGKQIIDLLFTIVEEEKRTLVVVTHDTKLAAFGDRTLIIDQGVVEL